MFTFYINMEKTIRMSECRLHNSCGEKESLVYFFMVILLASDQHVDCSINMIIVVVMTTANNKHYTVNTEGHYILSHNLASLSLINTVKPALMTTSIKQ